MRKIHWMALILGLFMTTAVCAATDTPRPPVGDNVVAYSGEQGVKVWTLRYGERAANQALVQIDGIDHDWKMRIQKMDVEKTNKDTRYSTQVDGKKFVVLIIHSGYGELYLPGEAQETMVGYDDTLSQSGNAQYFLTDYLQQDNPQ
ncbi:hypothetical protein AU509_04180 [Lonsdalea britannica]|nr:hypothetical protein [Lonsdalea britannica]OSM99971.1 hypothetical protein AU509_04180 [Lonsdalea britannica]